MIRGHRAYIRKNGISIPASDVLALDIHFRNESNNKGLLFNRDTNSYELHCNLSTVTEQLYYHGYCKT